MTTKNLIQTPVGPLEIRVSDGMLCGIDFKMGDVDPVPLKDPVARRVSAQLQAYFLNPDFGFDLPLCLSGTKFQKCVWQVMLHIPPGRVRSYGDIAREIQSSPRAVGNACRQNPVPIVVPCHRVVAANGIGGYAGATAGSRLEKKRWLLAHEGVQC